MFTNKYVVAILAAFVAVVLASTWVGTAFAQTVATTTNDGSTVVDYTGLFQSIGGLIIAIATLAGLVLHYFSKLNAKLGLVDQSVIEKLTKLLNEIKDTDLWNLENEQRLGAVLTFMYNTSPEAKKFMDEHAIDVKNLSASTDETKRQIEELYRKLSEQMTASALKK